jgi:hypothetical protein
LRPEKVRLYPLGSGAGADEYSEAGTVCETQYLGMATRVTVALADGTKLLATWHNAHADAVADVPEPGAAVLAVWKRGDAYALPSHDC